MTKPLSRRIALAYVATATLMSGGFCEARAAADLRLSDLRQTRERPLFSATRRPPPPIEKLQFTAAPPAPIVPPNLTLVGVVIGANEHAVLVQETASAKPVRVTRGQDIDGWRITGISPRSFNIQNGEHTATITFPPHK